MILNDLCSRARAAMNLILLLSLLQAWVIFTDSETSSAVERMVLLREHLSSLELSSRDPLPSSLQKLQSSLALPPDIAMEAARQLYSKIPLALLMEPTASDIGNLHPKISETRRMSGAEIIIRSDELSSLDDSYRLTFARAAKDVAEDIAALQSVVMGADLQQSATVGDLERSRLREIEIPFVNQKVEARAAWRLLALGLVGALLLLTAVARSMSALVDREPDVTFADWLPLYPTRLGYALSAAWLIAPPVLVLLASFSGVASGRGTYSVAIGFSTAALFAVTAALGANILLNATRVRNMLARRRRM